MKWLKYLILLLFIQPLWATDYDVIAAGGGDYTTIAGCAAVAVGGDRCIIHNGTYDEVFNPTNSGSSGNPITFIAETGHTPYVRGAAFGDNYITIDGLYFTHDGMTDDNVQTIRLSGNSHVVIQNCHFTDTTSGAIRANPNSGTPKTTYLTIKDNVFNGIGTPNSGDPDYLYGRGIGIQCWCDYALIEGNDMQHTADYTNIYGYYNVLRNNTFHDSYETETSGSPGLWTHIDGMQSYCTGTNPAPQAANYLLLEGNVMYTAPDSNVHFALINLSSCTTEPSNWILRYNEARGIGSSFFLTDGSASAQTDYKVYNNTMYDFPLAGSTAFGLGYVTTPSAYNNIIADAIDDGGPYLGFGIHASGDHDYNLAWLSTGSQTWVSPIADESNAILNDNPDFVSSTDLTLTGVSPAINTGGPLTAVNSSDTGSGTSLVVDDASFFQDGWAGVDADYIAVGTVTNIVQISSINYGTDTITLASGISRNDSDPIWLYKKSDGTTVLVGSAPDIGAYEYASDAGACDIDSDGDIDSTDVSFLVDVIQGRESSSKGDLNLDSYKDILDIMLLVGVVNGGQCPL